MKKRIVIVDKDDHIRLCTTLLLKMKGYDVISIGNSENAIQLIKKMHSGGGKIDLLICELGVSEIDGEGLIDILVKNRMAVPVMMMSECDSSEIALKMIRKGYCDFIRKPYEPLELEKIIESFFKRSEIPIRRKRARFQRARKLTVHKFADEVDRILHISTAYQNEVLEKIKSDISASAAIKKIESVTEYAIQLCRSVMKDSPNRQIAHVRFCNVNKILQAAVKIIVENTDDKTKVGMTSLSCLQLYCMADPDILQKIFVNIGMNAVEALKENGNIEFVLDDDTNDSGYLTVHVIDNGTGIAAGNISRIFRGGYSTKVNGSGIGLYWTRMVIENYGGSINVNSHYGEGSVFTIKLPKACRNINHMTGEFSDYERTESL